MPTNDRPRKGSGMSGIGGRLSSRPVDVTSSSAVSVQRLYASSTSVARSIGHNIMPA